MFAWVYEENSGTDVRLARACWTPTLNWTTCGCDTNCDSRTLIDNFPPLCFHFNFTQKRRDYQYPCILPHSSGALCSSYVAWAKHLGAPWMWSVCWGENPLSSPSQTDLFLNSDLYVYAECNNVDKQLRPLNILCWPSAEEHPGKLSEQTRLISGRCLWINRISWLLTGCDFIFSNGGGGGREIWIAAKVWNHVTTLESKSSR